MTERESENFDVHAFNRQVIAEFRENGGKLTGWMEGWSVCVLTTTGARTGERRETPLGYFEIDGQPLVVASVMGGPKNPAWYHNIRKNPQVTVETGTETYDAVATIETGERRDELFAAVAARDEGMRDYQRKTTRVLPVVTLHRIEQDQVAAQDSAGEERVRGLGDFLVEAHDWLRAELAELHRQVDEIIEGDASCSGLERAKPDLAQQLRTHCTEFCSALKQHHTGEDRGAFPMLAQQFPELAPALEKLGQEHELVARLQEEIRRLVDEYEPGKSDPAHLKSRLETMTSELEAHFRYEERTIVAALNTLGPAPNIP
ncbi:deazaflavin-dependent oxidoreductase, nitroreductase family [Saccharopolyspora antimicrobica]|uniref:Deazaflavin-dependent oxidoreductase (Nitroreductase family) n=1 Tax=Saccharopolyspora antimicrobica TaxID=455193 RepID=A0A1I5E9V3_9PSEU|nr:nitroreductase/quinone reductase family protein [Saccharopolyspora antimicrobica]RKT86731.1 deazaflavin-dependent oxidoreductase (nitroreductase family) [Saccharopolyspora antimicrobica]SFO08304.1 deazaflavin-dependent oxidoreductase, nitroreductase family [Saccharopolyspora antimicrobica]